MVLDIKAKAVTHSYDGFKKVSKNLIDIKILVKKPNAMLAGKGNRTESD